MIRWLYIVLNTALIIGLGACQSKPKADLMVYNARIYSCDSLCTVYEAMAVQNGRVLALGNADSLRSVYQFKQFKNLQSCVVYPGFIDAHCHFSGYAADMYKCSLKGSRSFDELLMRVKNYAKTASQEWIYGRGWDQTDWLPNDVLDFDRLNAAFPNRPVVLKRIDGHAMMVNQEALRRAGITAKTKIKGGCIELKNGIPTGLLIDNAMNPVEACIAPPPDSTWSRYLKTAQQHCLQLGLTGIQDCGVSTSTIRLLKSLYQKKELVLNNYVLVRDAPEELSYWLNQKPLKVNGLKVGGFKLYADGALGSRGACLKQAYSDEGMQKGFFLQPLDSIRQKLRRIQNSPYQVCTHAIGDSANGTVLLLYQEFMPQAHTNRWRIEHAQVIDQSINSLLLWKKIIPSVQPTHALSDRNWAEARLGQTRMQGAYAYKTLLRHAGLLALGTDFPVEEINPLHTFLAAVFRKDAKGLPNNGYRVEESISRTEALLGMTRWAAYASFSEGDLGSLEPGKQADFIVSAVDLIRDTESKIMRFEVLETYLQGKLVYQKK